MCGIAGVAGDSAERCRQRVRRMAACLVHRGPDSSGEFVDEQVAIGVRRLRVIDLATGDQPQPNEDRTIWTVCNGELYNFKELREGLRDRGHSFRTASDTEAIVHLYEEHGDKFVARLAGLLANEMWDAAKRTLRQARDMHGGE